MPRTEKLYYSRPDLRIAEATVLDATGSPEAPMLELDATIFYPEGGGQGCDLGSVGPLGGSGEVAVSAVIEEDGRILHALAAPSPAKPGDRVLLRLDGERRLDYSQAHSGQHLLSSTFMRLLGAATVSVHLGRERCLVDLDIPAISEDDLAQAEDLVEGIIADDYPIRVHSCPPEDLASFPLRKRPPVGEEVVRVVEIDGIDFTPCCGTHLSSTGKLRLLRVLGTEKYKGLTRLYFAAGGRAAADYRSVSRIARETARALGTSVSALPEAVAREAERRKALELAVGTLERERAAAEAAAAPEVSAVSGSEAAAPARRTPLRGQVGRFPHPLRQGLFRGGPRRPFGIAARSHGPGPIAPGGGAARREAEALSRPGRRKGRGRRLLLQGRLYRPRRSRGLHEGRRGSTDGLIDAIADFRWDR